MNTENLNPEIILDEDFSPEEMYPGELEELINVCFEKYEDIPRGTKIKTQFRNAYNNLVKALTEKRQFKQFNYL